VVLGLKIASFTYGGLLGLFILSRSHKKFTTPVLIFGLLSSLGTVFFLQWLGVAWTWYIGTAVVLNLVVAHGLHYLGWKKGFGFAGILFIIGYFIAVGGQYQNGLEVLSEDGFSVLKGKNVAVVVNHTSVDYHDDHLIKLAHDEGVRIKAVFSPEHGFKGVVGAGEKVDNGFENLTGAPIYSLYGKTKKPTSEMLKGIDILIFDMQDIGVRYYTYVSTLTLAMESAAENGIPFIVLDRVNPLGHEVEGVILEMEFASFVGMHPIPVRHGMSVGELAQMINGESWLENGMKADLNVIAYKGKIDEKVKAHAFNVPPSPNMPNVETAWLYQGLCLLEGTNLSEGRGTDLPFKLFGAPWLDNKVLADKLQKFSSKSDKYELISFTPQSIPAAKYPKYEGEECKGIRIITLENPLIWTIHLLQILQDQHPEKFKFLDTNFIDKLYGSDRLRLANEKDITAEKLLASDTTYTQFIELRKKYLIY